MIGCKYMTKKRYAIRQGGGSGKENMYDKYVTEE